MKTEKVYSPVFHPGITNGQENLVTSPIWKDCYKEEELTQELIDKKRGMHCYYIKFDGTTPVQVNKIEKVTKL